MLRRPPARPLRAGAHSMEREWRILTALQASAVPVPPTIAFCADREVTGAEFYVMQHVDGIDEHQIHLFPRLNGRPQDPPGVAAGIHTCAGAEIHRGWQYAVTALRISVDLTTGNPTHVRYDELGSIATIIENIDAATAARTPDVRRVIELQAQRPWVVPTLEALLSHSSIRETARLQNLHHSTMRQRIDWLEQQLGYNPLSGSGCARASTTLTMWRIAMAAERPSMSLACATAVCR